jgi:hypothetical protein
MGTRSTIALEYADGTIEQVYCHWDGYLAHNGQILLKHYSNPFILRDLIDLGDVSSLKPTIGTKHAFSHFGTTLDQEAYNFLYGEMTTFYGRDRGEDGVSAKKFKDYEDYVKNFQHEEYDYILRSVGGEAVWFVSDHDGDFVPLMSAIMDEQDRIAQEETA